VIGADIAVKKGGCDPGCSRFFISGFASAFVRASVKSRMQGNLFSAICLF
jgi:hypothetical protein